MSKFFYFQLWPNRDRVYKAPSFLIKVELCPIHFKIGRVFFFFSNRLQTMEEDVFDSVHIYIYIYYIVLISHCSLCFLFAVYSGRGQGQCGRHITRGNPCSWNDLLQYFKQVRRFVDVDITKAAALYSNPVSCNWCNHKWLTNNTSSCPQCCIRLA